MTDLYVKSVEAAEKYGFFQKHENEYWCRCGKGALNMSFDGEEQRLSFYSPNKDCIALLCEMYKNGDLIIVRHPEKQIRVLVSKDEYQALMKMRGQKNGQ